MIGATLPLSNTAIEPGCTQDFFYKADDAVDMPLIVRAQGLYMWDAEGRCYIDGSSGPICSNIGHCHPRVAQAMYAQALKLDFSYARVSRTNENLALTRRIASLAGPGFERVFLVSGGSEAVDIAIKFARQYRYATGERTRTRIISQMPSYHGMTLATLAISGDTAYEDTFKDMAMFSSRIPAPMTFQARSRSQREVERESLDALERTIRELGAHNVLAFVVEPVGGLATGCLAPSEFYFDGVRQICDRFGVALIFDEIMSGGGRTGKFLTAHFFPNARPDLVCLAKGIGGGYTPLGMMLAPARWVDELRELTGFNFAHTANANPISCATASAVLDVIADEKLIDNARDMGEYLCRRVGEMQARHSVIGDIRGRGLLLALEICDSQRQPFATNPCVPDRMRQLALAEGLLLYARRVNAGRYGDWVMLTPPLTITRAQCDEYLQRLERTIGALEQELRAANKLAPARDKGA